MKNEAIVLATNLSGHTIKEYTREFTIIKQLRPNLKRAVYHVSLNLLKEEQLDNKTFKSIAAKYLQEMGFKDNQFIVYRHFDSEHPHIHIVANRVSYSGEVVSESQDYKRSEAIVRALEIEFGLKKLSNYRKNDKSKLTKAEIEKTLRTGKIPIRSILQQKIYNLMLSSETVSEFILELLKEKIHPQFNISKTTNRISGISFMMDDILFKGSKLGKKYSWNSIKKYMHYEQNRDCAIIHRVNAGNTSFTKEQQKSIYQDAMDTRKYFERITETQRKARANSKQSKSIEKLHRSPEVKKNNDYNNGYGIGF